MKEHESEGESSITKKIPHIFALLCSVYFKPQQPVLKCIIWIYAIFRQYQDNRDKLILHDKGGLLNSRYCLRCLVLHNLQHKIQLQKSKKCPHPEFDQMATFISYRYQLPSATAQFSLMWNLSGTTNIFLANGLMIVTASSTSILQTVVKHIHGT